MLAGIPGHTKMGVMIVLPKIKNCRKCGRKVHMEFGKRGYKYIRCLCGNSMQAKVTAEEMIQRWNNRVPTKSILWKCK